MLGVKLSNISFRNCTIIYINFSRNFGKNNSATAEATFANGTKLKISCGKYARFANGSAVAEMGNSSVLVTAVSSKSKSQNSFVPLTVDYRLKFAAAGRIPTNFYRREMGSTEKEILAARLIDRSIRPIFPNQYNNEIQVISTVLAMDNIFLPDTLAINAASAALSVSDISWNGPVAAVRIGMCNGEILINPTRKELQNSTLDLVVTAAKDNYVVMLEGKGEMVPFEKVNEAIKIGTDQAKLVIKAIENLQAKVGKQKQQVNPTGETDILPAVTTLSEMRLREIFKDYSHDKVSRDNAVNEVRADVLNRVWSSYPEIDQHIISNAFNKVCKETFRNLIFEDKRCDGRNLNQLRPISCQVDLFKPLHGSALFQRGQTQVMCTVSLDSITSALKLDPLSSMETGMKSKNFMLHYEFPPFATGETGRVGSVGRREIGHGVLAEKALAAVLPNDFPFAIRLTSQVLESNGSSSMATVCGGSLALMDAGIPTLGPVAGVALGLITKYRENSTVIENYRILTDILGIEDYMGDMDMKVAGTKDGINAIQLDFKIPGAPLKIVFEALASSSEGIRNVLGIMNQCLSEYRKNRKETWPVVENLQLESYQKSILMGPGGINAQKIQSETGVQITTNDNSITLFAPSQVDLDDAKEIINNLMEISKVENLEFGGIYSAKIVELRDIGVMVTLFPNMTPVLLHNSQLDQKKIVHPSVLNLTVGQEIQVKYFGRDPVTGFMRLSRKAIQGPAISFVKNLDKSPEKLSS